MIGGFVSSALRGLLQWTRKLAQLEKGSPMSKENKFASHTEARRAGFFSRRHETNTEHLAEQARGDRERAEKIARSTAQNEKSAARKAAIKKVS